MGTAEVVGEDTVEIKQMLLLMKVMIRSYEDQHKYFIHLPGPFRVVYLAVSTKMLLPMPQ